MPTVLSLAKHLCLSLNTYSARTDTNHAHEPDDHGHLQHAGACCHCWAAANVLMQVVRGVEEKARDDERLRRPKDGDIWVPTSPGGVPFRYSSGSYTDP